MPIPAFDHNLVLPPHLGSPTTLSDLSPYPATTTELVHRFATSNERVNILFGLLNFRQRLGILGVTTGFQWLDGSFLEDIETQEGRAPRDLDILTIYWGYDGNFQAALFQQFPEFSNPVLSKTNFHLDHYPIDAGHHPELTVELTRYWVQLFTHNRNKVWKGMIRIELNTPADDAIALQTLQNVQIP